MGSQGQAIGDAQRATVGTVDSHPCLTHWGFENTPQLLCASGLMWAERVLSTPVVRQASCRAATINTGCLPPSLPDGVISQMYCKNWE